MAPAVQLRPAADSRALRAGTYHQRRSQRARDVISDGKHRTSAVEAYTMRYMLMESADEGWHTYGYGNCRRYIPDLVREMRTILLCKNRQQEAEEEAKRGGGGAMRDGC